MDRFAPRLAEARQLKRKSPMVWDIRTSNGNESAKIKWHVLQYLRGSGLDIGCGPWKISPHAWASMARLRIHGAARPRPESRDELHQLPIFADGVFDFVYSSHLLEHIVDTEGALREWLRVLIRGWLPGAVPAAQGVLSEHRAAGRQPGSQARFLPQDVINVMRRISAKVGLELIENEERNGGDEYSFLQVYRKVAAPGFKDCTQPRPAKRAAIVRPGVYGDSLWASSIGVPAQARGVPRHGVHRAAGRGDPAPRSEHRSAHRDGSHHPAGGALWPILGGRGEHATIGG
jgi:predicted SAM-dependent methyltransferase